MKEINKNLVYRITISALYSCGFIIALIFSFINYTEAFESLGGSVFLLYTLAFLGFFITLFSILLPKKTARFLYVCNQFLSGSRDFSDPEPSAVNGCLYKILISLTTIISIVFLIIMSII